MRMHGKRLLFSSLSHSPSEKTSRFCFSSLALLGCERQERKNGAGSLPCTLVSSVCQTLLQSKVSLVAPKEDAQETIALLFPLSHAKRKKPLAFNLLLLSRSPRLRAPG